MAVTHSDDDHCGSLSVLGDVAPASALLVPEGLPACSCKACSELMDTARAEGLADALVERLGCRGVLVVVEAEHLCMSMRGVRKPGSNTVTSAVRGIMRNAATRSEAMSLVLGRRS